MSRKLAVIGGTGLYSLQDSLDLVHREIVSTPFGEASGPLLSFRHQNQSTLLFLARHGVGHRLPPHKINYRANLWVLKQAGITDILSINAVGAIDPRLPPAGIALPDQLIDYTWGREHSFSNGEGKEVQHVDMTEPFSTKLRERVATAAATLGLNLVSDGVYGCTQGPRLETAAEVRRLQNDGCTVIGMTAMPEAALARELGMHYASLCLSVNWAAGIQPEPIEMAEIENNLKTGMQPIKALIIQLLQQDWT